MRLYLVSISFFIVLTFAAPPEIFAGTTHWANGRSPQEAATKANRAARARARRIRTCINTKAIPGTNTCSVGGPEGWQCYAVSANHKGSC